MGEGFGSLRHLGGRLAGSLWPGGPDEAGERWARSWLLAGETRLWSRMSGPDRRHALGVARLVEGDLAGRRPPLDPDRLRVVVAAALLHDVGKIDAGIGTWARVAVTATAMGVGRDRVAAWAAPGRAWKARAGRYVTHDRLGAALLEAAGSDAFTSTWAGEHHLPSSRQRTDRDLAELLTRADGD